MNYFNPYFVTASPISSPTNGIFSFLRNARGLNLGTILNGTQRTLNIINQAIPVIKQMSPVVHNARTMFRVMNEFKKVDSKESTAKTTVNNVNKNSENIEENIQNTNAYYNANGPTFFLSKKCF